MGKIIKDFSQNLKGFSSKSSFSQNIKGFWSKYYFGQNLKRMLRKYQGNLVEILGFLSKS